MLPIRCTNCGKKITKAGEELCAVCRAVATAKANKAVHPTVEAARIEAVRKIEQAEEVASIKFTFLTELLNNGGHVQKACKAAGVSRVTIGRYRDDDPDFALAWEAVQETNVERLESEADRRAMGFQKELTFRGEKTGQTITEYSDNLLIFRLKALKPEKYRDGPNVAGRAGAQMSEAELNEALAKMISRRSKRAEPAVSDAIN